MTEPSTDNELSAGYKGIGVLLRGPKIIPVALIVAATVLGGYGIYSWRSNAMASDIHLIKERLDNHMVHDAERLLVFRIICHAVTEHDKRLNKLCPTIRFGDEANP